MKLRLLPFLIMLALPCYAQLQNVRIGANTNLPGIETVTKTASVPAMPTNSGYYSIIIPDLTIEESYSTRPGVSVFGTFDINLGKKFFLRSGPHITMLNYTRTITVTQPKLNMPTFPQDVVVTPGLPMGSFYGYVLYESDVPAGEPRWTDHEPIQPIGGAGPLKENARLVWLQVPVLVGRSFVKDRLNVSAGFVTSLLLNESSDLERQNPAAIQRSGGTTTVLAGSKLVVGYSITQRVSLDIDGQYFFSPLYSKDYRAAGKSFARLFSAGVSYRIAR